MVVKHSSTSTVVKINAVNEDEDTAQQRIRSSSRAIPATLLFVRTILNA